MNRQEPLRRRLVQRLRRSRTLGWDRNPLRRRVDRLEAVMMAALLVMFLVGAPVLVTTIGHWVRATGTAQQRAEAAWRRVSATVQRSGQRGDISGPAGTVQMLARWTAPGGRSRTGWVPVSPQTEAGSSVHVWVTRTGSPSGQPLRPAQLDGRVAIVGVLTAYLLAVILILAGDIGRSLLRRRRLAGWEAEWQGVGPRWSRQR